jgi:Putative beta-barrel porin-2, OmpL-like. bbp2
MWIFPNSSSATSFVLGEVCVSIWGSTLPTWDEVIGGYDGYNDNFSRGFIFGYGIPFTHTGVKATYAVTSRVTAMLSICNGWDDVQRLNHAYTAAAQLVVTPTKTLNLTFNFTHGPERRQDTRDQRSVTKRMVSQSVTTRFGED